MDLVELKLIDTELPEPHPGFDEDRGAALQGSQLKLNDIANDTKP